MSWIGKPVRRIEDERLLKGQAKFVADVKLPETLEAVFVRSVHAHAIIKKIDATAARNVPGVAAVITAFEIAGRTAPICVAGEVHTPERLLQALKPLDRVHPTPLLPEERVTYIGQAVAIRTSRSRSGRLRGDPDAIFARAPVLIEEEFFTHRYVASPLETRGIQASVDPLTGTLIVWASTQTAHVLQTLLAVMPVVGGVL